MFAGVGVAAVSGLLLGGAMQPDLRGDERPEGPQIFAGWSGARSTGPFDDGMTLAYYEGRIPDYVVGTDWKQTIAWQDAPEIVEAAQDYSVFDEPEPAADTASYAVDASWQEPAADPPPYPSLSGGVAYGVDLPPPPPPPADLDPEAMPEATGDTTVIVRG
ncbi:hypothetical protein [Phenylobacterium sp.]|uniref:hypothetical protein n=1 Tax=Phenylobacterium sp. TaxID=1871053 RepID=UPI002D7E5248|nr:hypothetical protein [Phenylobacterium sp.]